MKISALWCLLLFTLTFSSGVNASLSGASGFGCFAHTFSLFKEALENPLGLRSCTKKAQLCTWCDCINAPIMRRKVLNDDILKSMRQNLKRWGEMVPIHRTLTSVGRGGLLQEYNLLKKLIDKKMVSKKGKNSAPSLHVQLIDPEFDFSILDALKVEGIMKQLQIEWIELGKTLYPLRSPEAYKTWVSDTFWKKRNLALLRRAQLDELKILASPYDIEIETFTTKAAFHAYIDELEYEVGHSGIFLDRYLMLVDPPGRIEEHREVLSYLQDPYFRDLERGQNIFTLSIHDEAISQAPPPITF